MVVEDVRFSGVAKTDGLLNTLNVFDVMSLSTNEQKNSEMSFCDKLRIKDQASLLFKTVKVNKKKNKQSYGQPHGGAKKKNTNQILFVMAVSSFGDYKVVEIRVAFHEETQFQVKALGEIFVVTVLHIRKLFEKKTKAVVFMSDKVGNKRKQWEVDLDEEKRVNSFVTNEELEQLSSVLLQKIIVWYQKYMRANMMQKWAASQKAGYLESVLKVAILGIYQVFILIKDSETPEEETMTLISKNSGGMFWLQYVKDSGSVAADCYFALLWELKTPKNRRFKYKEQMEEYKDTNSSTGHQTLFSSICHHHTKSKTITSGEHITNHKLGHTMATIGAHIDNGETFLASIASKCSKGTIPIYAAEQKKSVVQEGLVKRRFTMVTRRFETLRSMYDQSKSNTPVEIIKTESEEQAEVAQESNFKSEKDYSPTTLTFIQLSEKHKDLVKKDVTLLGFLYGYSPQPPSMKLSAKYFGLFKTIGIIDQAAYRLELLAASDMELVNKQQLGWLKKSEKTSNFSSQQREVTAMIPTLRNEKCSKTWRFKFKHIIRRKHVSASWRFLFATPQVPLTSEELLIESDAVLDTRYNTTGHLEALGNYQMGDTRPLDLLCAKKQIMEPKALREIRYSPTDHLEALVHWKGLPNEEVNVRLLLHQHIHLELGDKSPLKGGSIDRYLRSKNVGIHKERGANMTLCINKDKSKPLDLKEKSTVKWRSRVLEKHCVFNRRSEDLARGFSDNGKLASSKELEWAMRFL